MEFATTEAVGVALRVKLQHVSQQVRLPKKYLKEKLGIEFLSYVEQVGSIKTNIDYETVTLAQIEKNIVRCPDQETAEKMIHRIEEALITQSLCHQFHCVMFLYHLSF